MDLKAISRDSRNVSSRRLTSTVARQLAIEIIEGRLPPGASLPNEAALSEAFNVSRTALREAMQTLIARGFISSKPRIGATVNDRHLWSILDPDVLEWCMDISPNREMITALFEVRRIIEPAAVRLGAERHDRKDEAAIRVALEAMKSAKDSDDRLIADINFHSACISASHNPALIALIPALTAALRWSVNLKNQHSFAIFDASLKQHEDVMIALIARNGSLTESMMANLIDNSFVDTLAILSNMR